VAEKLFPRPGITARFGGIADCPLGGCGLTNQI
jgi:hypothetical protein